MSDMKQQEQIRRDQVAYGREVSKHDTGEKLTLASRRQQFPQSSLGPQKKSRPQRKQHINKQNSKTVRKLEGHELEIKEAMGKKQAVQIEMNDGEFVNGIIEKFDKYALKINTGSCEYWVFKSSMKMMSISVGSDK